jgi:hypothetical protein
MSVKSVKIDPQTYARAPFLKHKKFSTWDSKSADRKSLTSLTLLTGWKREENSGDDLAKREPDSSPSLSGRQTGNDDGHHPSQREPGATDTAWHSSAPK